MNTVIQELLRKKVLTSQSIYDVVVFEALCYHIVEIRQRRRIKVHMFAMKMC